MTADNRFKDQFKDKVIQIDGVDCRLENVVVNQDEKTGKDESYTFIISQIEKPDKI